MAFLFTTAINTVTAIGNTLIVNPITAIVDFLFPETAAGDKYVLYKRIVSGNKKQLESRIYGWSPNDTRSKFYRKESKFTKDKMVPLQKELKRLDILLTESLRIARTLINSGTLSNIEIDKINLDLANTRIEIDNDVQATERKIKKLNASNEIKALQLERKNLAIADGDLASPTGDVFMKAIINKYSKALGKVNSVSIRYGTVRGFFFSGIEKKHLESIETLRVFLTIDQTTLEEPLEEIVETIITSEVSKKEGSLDMTWFAINSFIPKGGMLVPKLIKHKNKKTKGSFIGGFYCRTFTTTNKKFSNNNNCLIEIFRWLIRARDNRSPFPLSNKIKQGLINHQISNSILTSKERNNKQYACSINDIPYLENYFNCKVRVISKHPESVIRILNSDNVGYNDADYNSHANVNLDLFRTPVIIKDSVLYESDRIGEYDFWVMLDNFHYWIIEKRVNRHCPISGLLLKGAQKHARYYDIKYQLIKDGRLAPQSNISSQNRIKRNKIKRISYIFFDYETICRYTNYSHVQGYCTAAIRCTTKRIEFDRLKTKLKPLNVKLLRGYKPNKATQMIIQEKFFIRKWDCSEELIDWIIKVSDPRDITILVGYNNNNFDNFPLLKSLLKKKLISPSNKTVLFAGNSILRLSFKSFRTLDLCKFLASTLRYACVSFKCTKLKDYLNHTKMQELYYSDPDNFMKTIKGYKHLEEYNIRDCECLAELFFKTSDAIKTICKRDIIKSMTIGGLAYTMWDRAPTYREKKDRKSKGLKPIKKIHQVENPTHLVTWKWCKNGCTAARIQAFFTGIFHGNYGGLDGKGLYPSVQMGMPFPIGPHLLSKTYKEGKLGVYNVFIHSQPKLNIAPRRYTNAPLDWTYEGSFNTRLYSPDIEMLRWLGHKVDVKGGLYWDKCSYNVFTHFTEYVIKMKTQQDQWKLDKNSKYNPALRSMVKFLANTLTGKVGQGMYSRRKELLIDQDDMLEFIATYTDITMNHLWGTDCSIFEGKKEENPFTYKQSQAKPCFLTGFIYSWARWHMYQAMYMRSQGNIKYTDTDCGVLEKGNKLVKPGIIKHLAVKVVDETSFQSSLRCGNIIKYIPTESQGIIGTTNILEDRPENYNVNDVKTLMGRFCIGLKPGMFDQEVEQDIEMLCIKGKKFYGMFSNIKHIHNDLCNPDCSQIFKHKFSMKGIGKDDRITPEDFDRKHFEDELTCQQQFEYFLTLPKAQSVQTFLILTSKLPRNIQIICRQLKRAVNMGNGNGIEMIPRFVVKLIRHKDCRVMYNLRDIIPKDTPLVKIPQTYMTYEDLVKEMKRVDKGISNDIQKVIDSAKIPTTIEG
jgi:hypothetical protein